MNTQRTSTLGRLGALALTAVLVLGACGGDDGETNDSAPAPEATTSEPAPADEALDTDVPDLCDLFTVEDFEAVFGEPAAPPETQEPIGAIRGTCTTYAEAGFPMVMLAAYDEVDRETTLSMVEAEPIDDLGVAAHWDDTMGLAIPMEGRDWYLQVLAMDGGGDRETSLRIAEMVLDRL